MIDFLDASHTKMIKKVNWILKMKWSLYLMDSAGAVQREIEKTRWSIPFLAILRYQIGYS